MNKLKFSGHETFIVRTFWPKKGCDFIRNGGNFSSEDAVVELGVGKNMVTAINFWLKALGLVDTKTNELTQLAEFLFGENGVDPYLEDKATIWLLHYYLIKTDFASIYSFVFNHLKKERSTFTSKQLASFIKRQYLEREEPNFNEKTVSKDISVFTRLYNTPDYKSVKKDFEDEISGLMLELELMSSAVLIENSEGSVKRETWFSLNDSIRSDIPAMVILFVILNQFKGDENISFRRLEIEPNSPGMSFVLSKEGLYKKIKEIELEVKGAIVSETAGNIVLSLPSGLDKWEILNKYYGN